MYCILQLQHHFVNRLINCQQNVRDAATFEEEEQITNFWGSWLRYYANRKMIAAKMVFFRLSVAKHKFGVLPL